MSFEQLFPPDLYAYVILPLMIFGARVLDVSLGTLRIIFVARGRRYIAPILGFFEVFIWIVVVSQVIRNLDSLVGFVAYAGGFATGNYVGMWIENKLAIGTLLARVIIPGSAYDLIERLHAANYGVTSVDAHGATGAVDLVYTIFPRRELANVMGIIHAAHPRAFVSVEEVRSTQEGIFPARPRYFSDPLVRRKGH